MEKFLSLPSDKQKSIIDAALRCFGINGYKKTSVSDIAEAAGISKSMVFHYFGSKKALYFYLIEMCGNLIMNEVDKSFDKSITDFFERLKLVTSIEISVIKQHPPTLAFLASVYFEKEEEVRDEIQAVLAGGDDFRNKIAFDGVDYSKFKASVDLKLLMEMLYWIADGYANQLSNKTDIDFDIMLEEFNQCLDMLKNNFYKEEYL
ncbi:MAG: TetR/AcrR family transcriptional regulator [Bacillota bacterium]|nr:TetR/AcrR family transcriptional regulator [Bacillota bacterium]